MIEVNDIEAKILDKMRKLDPFFQAHFLAYLDTLEVGQSMLATGQRVEGEPGSQFVQDVLALKLSEQDVEEIERAIEEAFEIPEAHFPEVDLDV